MDMYRFYCRFKEFLQPGINQLKQVFFFISPAFSVMHIAAVFPRHLTFIFGHHLFDVLFEMNQLQPMHADQVFVSCHFYTNMPEV